MKLLLLGTTGYHPNDRRHTACFMLPEPGVVLDAGTGMYRVGRWLATTTLDIFLSHAHLDHVIGLTFLFDVVRDKTVEQVVVHGEPEKLKVIEEHLFNSLLFPARPDCQLQPLADAVTLADGGKVTHFPLHHPGGVVGYRIDWADRSLAYVTDTTARLDAPYVDRIRGVDVLIHECYFPDAAGEWAAQTGHSCTTPVAQVAKAAGVGRLILVHMDPGAAEGDPVGLEVARSIFPATDLGTDGMQIEF